MDDDGFDARLASAGSRLEALSGVLLAGGPWPLAERFDHAPEASWGPREVLAHLEEMLPYWLGEIERIMDMASGPEPFGRVGTDDLRLAIIERDRTLPIRELESRIASSLERWRRRWAELDESARDRRGLHPIQGEMTVAAVAERMVARHLDDHLDQLTAIIEGGAAPA